MKSFREEISNHDWEEAHLLAALKTAGETYKLKRKLAFNQKNDAESNNVRSDPPLSQMKADQ
jgi:hypothetical protein